MNEKPRKKSVDYPFLLVLVFVIAIGGYWIVHGIRSQNLDPYLDYLGKKLVAVLPEAKDKEKVQTLYNEFRANVKENKIAPEEVEEVAAEILNIHNLPDSLAARQAEELLASVIPRAELNPQIPETEYSVTTEPIPEADEKKWQELEKKLSNIYEFEYRLQKEKLDKNLRYRIDRGLQIIIDARRKEDLLKAKQTDLVVTLENLEKEKFLIWSEDFMKDFQHHLDSVSVVIETYPDSLQIKRFKVPEVHVRPPMDSITGKNLRSSRRARSSSR